MQNHQNERLSAGFFRHGYSRWLLATSVLLGLIFLPGCQPFPPPPPEPQWKPGPETRVLDQATLDALTAVDEDGTLVFSAPTPMVDSLVPGNVVVLGATEKAPCGMLRRVTDVQKEGTRTTVRTTPATLVDALEEGRVNVTGTLTSDGVVATTTARGVDLAPSAREIHFNLDTQLADGIWMRGSLELRVEYDFTVDVRWRRGIEHVNLEVNVVERAHVSIEGTKAFSRNVEKQIARLWFTPITVHFVVVVPVLTVYVGVDGSVQASFRADVTQAVTATAGARYKEGWTNLGRFDPQFDFQNPQVSVGNLAARGYAKAEVGLLVFGVVGPYAVVTAYLELEADASARPRWVLYGGLSSYAGVKFQILGHRLDYETGELAGVRRRLASEEGGSPIGQKRILLFVCSARNDSDGWYSGPGDVRPLADALRSIGYSLHVEDQRTILSLTLDYLKGFSQVWILESDYDQLIETTEQEAQALYDFYRLGGGVWISLEWDGTAMRGRPWNWTEDAIPYLRKFGLDYGGVLLSRRATQSVRSNHPLFAGVHSVCFDETVGNLVVGNSKAEVIFYYEASTPTGLFPGIATLDERLNGRGRALFDTGWVIGYAYWKKADNLTFAQNVARWLEP